MSGQASLESVESIEWKKTRSSRSKTTKVQSVIYQINMLFWKTKIFANFTWQLAHICECWSGGSVINQWDLCEACHIYVKQHCNGRAPLSFYKRQRRSPGLFVCVLSYEVVLSVWRWKAKRVAGVGAAQVGTASAARGASQIKDARVLQAIVPAALVLLHPARTAVQRPSKIRHIVRIPVMCWSCEIFLCF